MKQKRNQESGIRNQGFTLIELLVVIAVTATISGISIANYRAAEKQKRAEIAIDTIINAIRNAQNNTLTGKFTNNANASCRTPQYYLITFNYTSTSTLSAFNNCSTTDSIETYTLPVNVRIKAASLVLDGNVATTNITFVFYPPFGAIKASIDGNAYATFTTATLTAETTDQAATRTTAVDGVAGRIGL